MTTRRLIADFDTWAAMRSRFRWDVPKHFNIAERCCDSWAARSPDKLAIRHLASDGTVKDWSYGDLKAASDGLALSLLAQGVGNTVVSPSIIT